MAQILEIARYRLKESLPMGPHPDENLLTAFVEGTLGGNLRTRVLKHLCNCPACRGVVAISRPEAMPATATPVAARWSWPRWPSLGWANAFAATAVLAGIAWIGRMEIKTVFLTTPVQVATTGSVGVPQQRPATSLTPAAEPAIATVPHSSHSAIAAMHKPASASMENSPALGAREFASLSSPVGAARQPWSALTSQEKISPSVAINSVAPRYSPPGKLNPTKWMVSQSGVLYQSFDNGRRWQSVAVRENAGLRSVSSVGIDIWTGGAAGALFHSSDAGHSWTQVIPSYNGLTLADDIEQVAFADANHGTVTTTSGKTWVTADGGETWEIR